MERNYMCRERRLRSPAPAVRTGMASFMGQRGEEVERNLGEGERQKLESTPRLCLWEISMYKRIEKRKEKKNTAFMKMLILRLCEHLKHWKANQLFLDLKL